MEPRPLNVVHLIQGLETGGLENMVCQLVLRQDPKRFLHEIIGYDSLGPLAKRLEAAGVHCRLVRRNAGVDWRYLLRLTGELTRIRPHILHLHNPTAFFYGAFAGRLARIPCVFYTEHGRDSASSKHNIWLHRFLSRLVDRVVAVSDSSRVLLEREGVPSRRIVTIHNGIDTAPFLERMNRTVLRARLGFASEQPLVGIVARLDPVKNHVSLLRAMAQIIREYPDACLLVIGDGPLRGALERLARELGVAEHIRFLGIREDVPDLLAMLDVAVLCSLGEGLSMTLLEQGAAGVPVVATDTGGNPEVVEHGRTGILVPVGDDGALARAICDLLAAPDSARAMGEAGRLRILEEFAIERMATRYASLYESCVGARHSVFGRWKRARPREAGR